MDSIEMLQSAINDINGLILQGIPNWKRALSAVGKINAVIEGLSKEQETKQKAYDAAIEDARKRREEAKAEAARNGEEILGGETIRINADGSQEVLIP